jgi:hypothetical protein
MDDSLNEALFENESRYSILTFWVSDDFQEVLGYIMYFVCGSTIFTLIVICLLKSLEVI